MDHGLLIRGWHYSHNHDMRYMFWYLSCYSWLKSQHKKHVIHSMIPSIGVKLLIHSVPFFVGSFDRGPSLRARYSSWPWRAKGGAGRALPSGPWVAICTPPGRCGPAAGHKLDMFPEPLGHMVGSYCPRNGWTQRSVFRFQIEILGDDPWRKQMLDL